MTPFEKERGEGRGKIKRERGGEERERKERETERERERLRRRPNKPPLPSLFLANARSLRHKVDELHQLIATKKDFRDCSAYCITESWFDPSVPDSAISNCTPGFTLLRSDREFNQVDKDRGGGVCFLINDSWCTNAKIRLSRALQNLRHW